MEKVKILVVDDDPAILILFQRILGSMTYEVYTGKSGLEAIKIVKQHPCDVAFIDIRMSGMDGLETFRALRKLDSRMMVVIITGFAEEEKIEAALKEGAAGCIKKPFDLSAIKAVIARKLEQQGEIPIKVLVVDDEELISELFMRLARMGQYSLKLARNAESALRLMKKECFDVAFLDIVLPGENGIELCDQICRVSPGTKVILFTGSASHEKAMEAKVGKGASYALKKPFDVRDIRKILVEIIEKKSEERKASAPTKQDSRGR